jgi:MoaA/NifB/PqqE/SkfB family radical SAM enzyme
MNPRKLIAVEPTPQFRKVLRVEWLLTRKCNFSCSYCHEYERGPHGRTDLVENAIQLLQQKAGTKKIALLLTGGEPTLHPDFKKIVKTADSFNMRTQVVTNGSQTPDFYKECIPSLKDFTFSIHLEMNFEKTMRSLMAVYEAKKTFNDVNILVHLVALPGKFDNVLSIYNELKSVGIKTIVRRIRPMFNSDGFPILPENVRDRTVFHKSDSSKSSIDFGLYTTEEISMLLELRSSSTINTNSYWINEDSFVEEEKIIANTLGTMKLNRFKGWTCWAGIERLQIDYNGDVYRGTCRVGDSLGNFFSDYNLPSDPITCTRNVCTCAWSMAISKADPVHGISLIEYGREMLAQK